MTLGINGAGRLLVSTECPNRILAHYYENGVPAHYEDDAASASRSPPAARVAPCDSIAGEVIQRNGGAAFFFRRERPSRGTIELLHQLRILRGFDRAQRGAGEAGGAGHIAVMHGALHLQHHAGMHAEIAQPYAEPQPSIAALARQ